MVDTYGLSEEDRATFREVVSWWGQQPPNRPPHGSVEESNGSQTGVQIARTPEDGIPGSPTDHNDLEYAECQLYALEKSGGAFRLVEMTGLTERVYNLGSTAIDGLTWTIIHQDRQGYWWTSCSDCAGPDEVFTGTGTGTSTVAVCCDGTIPDTIYATFGQTGCTCAQFAPSFPLVYDPVTAKWVGTHKFGTCVGANNLTIRMWCNINNALYMDFSWSTGCSPDINSVPRASQTCSPFSAVFGTSVGPGVCGCDGNGDFSVSVTE